MAEYAPTTPSGACIFCEIAAGRLQADGVFWEDDAFMAFLAIDPNTEGFTCVIPKQHYGSDVLAMPDVALKRYILTAKHVAGILMAHFPDVGRVGLMMEGTGIDHAHIKLAPFHGTEHLKRGVWRQMPSGKEFWFDRYEGWMASCGGPRADPAHLRELAAKLRVTVQRGAEDPTYTCPSGTS